MGADAAAPVVGEGAGAALAALVPESGVAAGAFSAAWLPEDAAESPEVEDELVLEAPSSFTPLR